MAASTKLKEFAQDWTNLKQGLTFKERFVEHFNEHIAPGRTFTNVLSIGPGDCSMEHSLLKTSLHLAEKLYLVEPDEKFRAKSRIQCEGHACQVECFNQTIENYNHEGPKLDLILASHSLYYFYHQGAEVLDKLRSWLAEEGIVVISVDNSPFLHKIDELMTPQQGYKIAVKKEELEGLLTRANLKFTLSWTDLTWDMSGYEDHAVMWGGFFTNRQISQQESHIAKKIIQEFCSPGNDLISGRQIIAVCHL